MKDLASTLGLKLFAEVSQPLKRPHAGLFFGTGKVRDLREWVDALVAGRIPDEWVPGDEAWVPLGEEDLQRLRVDTAVFDAEDELEEAWWSDSDGEPEENSVDPSGFDRGGADQETPSGSPVVEVSVPGRGRVSLRGGPSDSDADDEERAEKAKETARRMRSDLPDHIWASMPSYDPDKDPPLLLVLDGDVKPSVLFNLEERLRIEVWDRTRLILEIFSAHAHVKEARLQVELAKLQYEVPLIREAVHRKRGGERPGFMGGGEYGVAEYENFIKRRMGAVRAELSKIQTERDVRRRVRKKGFYLVSLAGYTNAGKSTLLNALTGSDVLSQDILFATLGTTTRRLGGAPARGERTDHLPGVGRSDEASPEDWGDDEDEVQGDPLVASGNGGTREGGRPSQSQNAADGGTKATIGGTGRASAHFDVHQHENARAPRHLPSGEGDPLIAAAQVDGVPGEADHESPGAPREGALGLGGEFENPHGKPPQTPRGAPGQPADRTPPMNRYERPLLLTDTVGFIQSLPGWLLDAFHSTLEEIALSDLVLLTVDASDDMETLLGKVRVCQEELAFLDVECPILLVMNKADKVPETVVRQRIDFLVSAGHARRDRIITVSAQEGTGLAVLRNAIDSNLPALRPYTLQVPIPDVAAQADAHRVLDEAFHAGAVYGVETSANAEPIIAADAPDHAEAGQGLTDTSPGTGSTMTITGECDPIHRRSLARVVSQTDSEWA